MKMKGAIFDLDGTLLESMEMWDHLGEAYLRAQGIVPKEGLSDRLKWMTLRQAAAHFQSQYQLAQTVAEIEKEINASIETFYRYQVLPKDGADELLRQFYSRGIKMCVVTATDQYLVKAAFSRLGWLGYFQGIITCGDVGLGKDQGDIFEYALRVLKTEKEYTPVFEDAIHAVKTAKTAGFPVIAVQDKSFAKYENQLRETADTYICSLREMGACFD
ncbi:HAD family phosphatase [Aminipila butyrica]|uniref:HAD family phosphatase n=1 Tax=Aminipila butyrica TaxID=433296 RepID=A0A858BXU5_9FIRM|nr:HAD family phosphatase [Aminipila butyrica]QIB69730.1 HAD family phosphatase [Aminipila butyrica]